MDPHKILIVPSKSRYELEVARYGSEERAEQGYVPAVWKNIRSGHLAQKENLDLLEYYFSPEQFVDRSELTPALIDKYGAFVFLGGDNHFTYCSQIMLRYLQKNAPDKNYKKKMVLGTVLDPKRSWGGQLYFTVDDLIGFLPKLKEDNFEIEKWAALEANVMQGDKTSKLYPAINEIFVGETKRWMMSRNQVYLDGRDIFPDKSSGILIATGTGSGNGSWYDNVHSIAFGESDVFSREAACARVILTEHKSRIKTTLYPGQVLTIHSSNDDAGVILPDSHEERAVSFPMGGAAEIRIGSLYLPVVRKSS